MDSTTLVSPPNLEEGRKAVQAVKAARVPLRQAFWAYFTDAHEWRLVFVTPWLKTKGPIATYTAVLKAFEKNKVNVQLSHVTLARPDDPYMRAQNAVFNADYAYDVTRS